MEVNRDIVHLNADPPIDQALEQRDASQPQPVEFEAYRVQVPRRNDSGALDRQLEFRKVRKRFGVDSGDFGAPSDAGIDPLP